MSCVSILCLTLESSSSLKTKLLVSKNKLYLYSFRPYETLFKSSNILSHFHLTTMSSARLDASLSPETPSGRRPALSKLYIVLIDRPNNFARFTSYKSKGFTTSRDLSRKYDVPPDLFIFPLPLSILFHSPNISSTSHFVFS